MQPLRALSSLLFLALCGGNCDLPFGPIDRHTLLYLSVVPQDSAYVFPPEDEVPPPDVARLFLALVARMGLERLLDHAIATWIALAQPGHEIFERDRWWCTAPACLRAQSGAPLRPRPTSRAC
jgi:hypothetical protein